MTWKLFDPSVRQPLGIRWSPLARSRESPVTQGKPRKTSTGPADQAGGVTSVAKIGANGHGFDATPTLDDTSTADSVVCGFLVG